MKTVCAWCDAIIRDGSLPVSHGICVSCRDHFFRDAGVPLQKFIDGFPFPVLVLGSSLQPVAVNRSGAQESPYAAQLTPAITLGNVVECEHSHQQEGCGKTVHCSGCVLRKTVEQTNQSGDSAFLVPATISTENEDIRFYVSTLKVDGRVFVKLDKVEP
jgi:hypothetical protein